jgi:hypothetical protein
VWSRAPACDSIHSASRASFSKVYKAVEVWQQLERPLRALVLVEACMSSCSSVAGLHVCNSSNSASGADGALAQKCLVSTRPVNLT